MKTFSTLFVIFLVCRTLFLSAHPDDIYWSSDFGLPSTDQVRAILVDGDYIYYNEFAGLVRRNIKTNEYKILGLSQSGTINTIVKHNEDLYIGGSFENFNGSGADFIAKWNGTNWEKVADSIDGKVLTICFDNDDNLWIGGEFRTVDGVDSRYIAYKKDGQWEQVPKLNNQVRSIINVNGVIYVGGDFYYKDLLTEDITCVVKWDGVNWLPVGSLGNQCGSRVFTLTSSPEGVIFAGGYFFRAADTTISNNVAMFFDGNWRNLGDGLDDMVFTLEWHNGYLYAGGYFDHSGETDCKRIAVFDGNSWQEVDGGIGGKEYPTVLALFSVNDEYLYCGGNFNISGDLENWGLVRLNSQNKWENFLPVLRNGTVSSVMCFDIDRKNNILYVGGGFVKTGKVVSYGLAKFDGQQWHGCNEGLTPTANSAYSLHAINDTVYFTGWFDFADGIRLRNVARWLDPQKTWQPIGNGIEGADFDLGPIRVTEKDIYVGGDFKTAENDDDTITVNYITRWDGEKWNAMDGGLARTDGRAPIVKKIVRNGDLIYITGLFDLAGRGVVGSVAVWDIKELMWVASPINIEGYVAALYIDGDDFYFGGQFQKAGNLDNVNNIVKWNRKNNTWSRLASGVSGTVSAITKWGDDIYVAGSFREASGVVCNSIAKYNKNEDKFEPLGSGITSCNRPGRVADLIVYKNELYLGGSFTNAGSTKQSSNIAKWSKIPVSVNENIEYPDIDIKLSPNPTDGFLNVEITSEKRQDVSLEIFNLSGERLRIIYRGGIPAGVNYFYFETQSLSSGAYFLVCRTAIGIKTEKVIITR